MVFPGASRLRTRSNELPADEQSTPSGPLDVDWPRQATEQIVKVVDQVRDQTTGPILDASRWVVYGLVAMIAAGIIGVLSLIGTIRLLDVVLPRGVWAAYLLIGLVFTLAGTFCWRKRDTPARA